MKRKSSSIFTHIIRNSVLTSAISGYLVVFLSLSIVLLITEPTIETFGDALWYSFVSCTTIGFGDFAATSFLGRIITVILYVYTVLILALITAVFTQLFFEMSKAKLDESVIVLQNDLEHLEDLPKERLAEISKKIKAIDVHKPEEQ